MFNKKRKKIEEQPVKPVKSNKGKKILLWIVSIFCIIMGLSLLPRINSYVFFLLSVLLLPIGKLQELWKRIFPKKIKGILCVVLTICAFINPAGSHTTAPTKYESNIPQAEEQIIENETKTDDKNVVSNEKDTEVEEDQEQKETETKTDTNTDNALPLEEIPSNSTFEIHYIDVGQGDAALVLCDEKAMLIDGGTNKNSSLIYSYLKNQNVSYLDYIVGTHPHADHIGGLAGALNYAEVGTAYCSVSSYDSEAFGDFTKYLDKQDKDITIPKAGDSFRLGSATVEIVGIDSTASEPNNTSIVLRITYGNTSFIFTGDAERDAEQKILNAGYNLESTVLKVGHHGSANATSYPFLRAIAPQYAIISVGKDNSYGHPAEDTLSRLRDADVKLFRTDIQGTIICVSDGSNVSFTVSKNKDADTFAIVPTVEALTAIVKPACDSYNSQTNKKLDGTLSYKIKNATTVELTFDVKSSITKDQEYLVNDVMEQILTHIIGAINNSTFPEEVEVNVNTNYDIQEDSTKVIPEDNKPAGGTDYVGNKNSKKFHYSWCSSVSKMKESNKYYYTGTREEMIAKGYTPCQNCNP